MRSRPEFTGGTKLKTVGASGTNLSAARYGRKAEETLARLGAATGGTAATAAAALNTGGRGFQIQGAGTVTARGTTTARLAADGIENKAASARQHKSAHDGGWSNKELTALVASQSKVIHAGVANGAQRLYVIVASYAILRMRPLSANNAQVFPCS